MRKYQTWACLNVEGKAIWGDVFLDGEVPIRSIIAQTATLEGINKPEGVFLVDWKALNTRQQEVVLEKISIKTGANKEVILKDILEIGLPLREKYTEFCGTNRIGLFI